MINVLIADDSSLARDIIRDFLEEEGSFKIIGEAKDGEEAVEKILSLNPDLVTLDMEMPKKTGMEVIDEVLGQTNVPIVVVTSHDTAQIAYEASLKGALEFYPKNIFTLSTEDEKRKLIYETLKRISGIKARKNFSFNTPQPAPDKRTIKAVLIASSTGGPKALMQFFSNLPRSFPIPIIIVQHNSTGFDTSFAKWLNNFADLNVKLADDGEKAERGQVYIAPTDKHLEITAEGDSIILNYNDSPMVNNQKPSADVLFRSASVILGESVISIVLTGMGNDGAAGTRLIKERGGITLAQDEGSSLIFGMPKAAIDTGCVDLVLPLEKIPIELEKLIL